MRNPEIPWSRVGEDLWEITRIATLFIMELWRRSLATQAIMAVAGFVLMFTALCVPIALPLLTWMFLTVGVVIYVTSFLFLMHKL